MMRRQSCLNIWKTDRGIREWARIERIVPGEVRYRFRERCV